MSLESTIGVIDFFSGISLKRENFGPASSSFNPFPSSLSALTTVLNKKTPKGASAGCVGQLGTLVGICRH